MSKQTTVRELILQLLRSAPSAAWTQDDIANGLNRTKDGINRALKGLVDGKDLREYRGIDDGRLRYRLPTQAESRWAKNDELHKKQKMQIASLTQTIICGGAPGMTAREVQQLREEFLKDVRYPKLTSFMDTYFSSRERTVYIDGGTTGKYISGKLRAIQLPSEVLNLWQLVVLTNCPPVATELMQQSNGPSTILIGGRISRDTNFMSGHLAEVAIREWRIYPDIALVGVSGLDLEQGFFSHSEDEAAIKKLTLANARLRCVAMTSKKIVDYGGGTGEMLSCFAPFQDGLVDAVITDQEIESNERALKKFARHQISVFAWSRKLLPNLMQMHPEADNPDYVL